jgi:hypothetical protein
VTTALEVGYWIFPRPIDQGLLLREALGADELVLPVPEYKAAMDRGHVDLGLSLVASCLFALVMLALAAYELVMAEY